MQQLCKNAQMEWNDMKLVLALGRHRTMSGAGVHLNMSHTTVSRRIKKLEKQSNAVLFEYSQKAWHLTKVGQKVYEIAQQVEIKMLAIDRSMLGHDEGFTGAIRVSTVDLLTTIVAEAIKDFSVVHPDVAIEISCTSTIVNLNKREADVVLRAQQDPPENLVGFRLFRMAYAVYAAESLLDELGLSNITPDDWNPNDLPWITWSGGSHAFDEDRWMDRNVDPSKIVCKVGEPATMVEFAKQGVGATIMVSGFCENIPGMRRLSGSLVDESVDLWLLTHQDLRKTARIKTFMKFVQKQILKEKELFEGAYIPEEKKWR